MDYEERYDAEELDSTLGNNNDISTLYMKEVNKIPLLTREEEIELAKKVADGDGEAKEKFIKSNLRLVFLVANRYAMCRVPFLDLVQEGNIGLMKAVNKYDVNMGVRFASYAIYWINREIFNYIAYNGKNVKIPAFAYNMIGKYRKVVKEYLQLLNRYPSVYEIANEMNITVSKAKKIQDIKFDMINIDELVGDDNDKSIENTLMISNGSLDDITAVDLLASDVKKLLIKCRLSEMEINVLKLRYGLNNGKMLSLKKIGDMFNLTSQRISQIENAAITKIRLSKEIIQFAWYMQSPTNALRNIDNYRDEYYKKKLRKKQKNTSNNNDD